MTKQVLFLASIAAAIFFVVGPVRAAQSTYPVEATVFICDNDGTCDSSSGENSTNCSADCVSAVCGDGTCDSSSGETAGNCAADCHCGNGLCDYGETNSSCSADCVAAPPVGSGMIFLEINNLQIRQSSLDSAIISWRTNLPAICRFFWGDSWTYGSGLMTETFYSMIHSANLEKLTAEKVYYFKISCQEAGGRQALLDQASFVIKQATVPTLEEITNVSDLNASVVDGRVRIYWRDPPGKNYDEVVIVRNGAWPARLGDGEIIYRGLGEQFGDGRVAYDAKVPENKAYYTVFGVKGDRYSSGAFFTLIIGGEKISEKVPPPPAERELNLYDFDFWADEKILPIIDDTLTAPAITKRLSVSIEEEKIPTKVDFLTLTIKTPSSTQEFFLTKDELNKKLSAVIGRLGVGDYDLYLTGYDREGKAILLIQGRVKIRDILGIISKWLILNALIAGLTVQAKGYQPETVREMWWLWLVLGFLLMLIFFWLKRRRKKKKKIQKKR